MRTIQDINNEISLLEEKLKNVKGKETEVYTRIVGYHRAVSNWNKGKKEEYFDRVPFVYDNEKVLQILKKHKIDEKNDEVELKDKNKKEINVKDITFYKLFQSDYCRNCPPVKEFVKKLNIPGEEIDVSTDFGLSLARKYDVLSTPTVVLFDSEDKILYKATSIEELKKIFS